MISQPRAGILSEIVSSSDHDTEILENMLSKIINTFEDSKKNISIDNRIWRFKVAKLGAEEETGHDRDCVHCGSGVEECVAALLLFLSDIVCRGVEQTTESYQEFPQHQISVSATAEPGQHRGYCSVQCIR